MLNLLEQLIEACDVVIGRYCVQIRNLNIHIIIIDIGTYFFDKTGD